MYFRPALVPTLIAVPSFIILLALGNWQLERRAWKLDLIETIETRLSQEATPLSELLLDIEDSQNLNYWPVRTEGRFLAGAAIHKYALHPQQGPGVRLMIPFEVSGIGTILVDRGFVPMHLKDRAEAQPLDDPLEADIAGIIRTPTAPGSFTPENDISGNLWYHIDIDQIRAEIGSESLRPLIIELAPDDTGASGYPLQGFTRLSIRNQHLGYAITWFGLALGLLAVYTVYHLQEKRLSLRPPQ